MEARAMYHEVKNMMTRHIKNPKNDTHLLKYVNFGLQDGDFDISRANVDKLMRPYVIMKNMEIRGAMAFRDPIRIQHPETK
mmetsp:Transcript_12963/g.20788  ORF Transcript_12963/g.20788 Transcript_12963/m.20788 type:complete len:81 (+) Transcript_12963:1265-1507(+)